MKEENPSERVLPGISRAIIIGHKLLDEHHHVNNAKQHDPLEEERERYMTLLGTLDGDILAAFGESPFIVNIDGKYRRQMFEKNFVVIDTNAKIAGSKMIFYQSISIINDRGKETASEFQFTALNLIQNGTDDCKMPASPYANTQSPLNELTNEIKISPEWLNENGRLKVRGYLSIYEVGRRSYFKNKITDDFGLMPVVARVSGDFKQQIFGGGKVIVKTVAENKKSHILFTQHLLRDGIESSRFQFGIALTDANGKPTRVPMGWATGVEPATVRSTT